MHIPIGFRVKLAGSEAEIEVQEKARVLLRLPRALIQEEPVLLWSLAPAIEPFVLQMQDLRQDHRVDQPHFQLSQVRLPGQSVEEIHWQGPHALQH